MTNAQPHDPPAWQLGLAGLLSLAVAMGIGRFAFTPMIPLMLQDGQLDVAAGGWVAAANCAGYPGVLAQAGRLSGCRVSACALARSA